MKDMKNLFKNPKTRMRNLLLVILPFVILIIIFGFISVRSISSIASNSSGNSKESYKYSIDSMDYHLRNNATDYQEELFKELSDAVNDGSDKFKIATLVAENFVADFYTWTNKEASYDVGGMYYVYSPQKVTIYHNARDNYYKYLTYYINTFGSDKLLEVESIEATVSDTTNTYELDGKSYVSYFVTCDWTYKNLDTFSDIKVILSDSDEESEDGFVTRCYFTIIENEDGRFEIAQAYGDY